ncbi:hypothetical protein [Salmonirosea aquatica]|uniref:Uncharacterized protein n=1 Tax=Salmonirosea aquatica TaxID=2654236 RepID=A0A7C9F970_9BACT|nr:hypothetical protein [Cytophagaceae bacterium SJW1-29]
MTDSQRAEQVFYDEQDDRLASQLNALMASAIRSQRMKNTHTGCCRCSKGRLGNHVNRYGQTSVGGPLRYPDQSKLTM